MSATTTGRDDPALSAWLRSRPRAARLPVADRRGPLPASAAQRRLWLDHQLQAGTDGVASVYHATLMVHLTEEVDPVCLQSALDQVVRRHEALRTTFTVGPDGTLRQRVDAHATVPLRHRWQGDPAERNAGLRALFRAPFDLENAPPLRAGLFSTAADDHILLLVAHHIATDGWSMDILHRELAECYRARSAGRPPALPALDRQYADYAAWEHHGADGATAADLDHWTTALADVPALLETPADRPRERHNAQRCGLVRVTLDRHTVDAADAVAADTGAARFQVVLAALYVLLSRWCGRPDLIIGTPAANRRSAEVEGIVGFFVNLLPLPGHVDERDTFTELVARTRETVVDGYDHGAVTFDRIVEAVAPQRLPGTRPLVQVVATMQDPPADGAASWGRRLEFTDADTAQMDLTFSFAPDAAGRLELTVYYSADLFDDATIERLAHRFADLLRRLTTAPHDPLLRVPAVTADEAAGLDTFAASTPEPGTPAVTELFRRQVDARPDAPAILDQGRLWTYRELDDLAERMAATVRARRLPPAAAVAVRLPRSATQIAAMLGVLRSGHVYLPVDPANPADRLARILRDADCPLLLTDAARPDLPAWAAELVEVVDVGTAGSRVAVDRPGDRDRAPVDPRRPAYLIYTSGSTGRPKGVEVDHAALSSVIQCYVRQYDLTPADRLSQTMNHSFDAGLLDTLPALVCGASIAVLPDEARLEPTALWDRLAEAGVTLSFITTALFTAALDNAPTTARGLRMLQFGGELCTAVPEGLPFPLEHMYGPTEASIWASAGPLDPAGRVHIGRPVGGLTARVLDDWLRPVPAGVAGELYLAGERLALGYRGAAGATATRFVPDPWTARGGRMYRTGDRVRWNRDGRLEFLGRTDAQVKLRGFRVELGEIEAVLAGHPAVAEVTVVVRAAATGQRQLCAYLRLHPGGTVAAVRTHAEQQLPVWMLPASFTVLTSFPLNANGKTDHGALPPPDPAPVRAFEAPVGAVEELMAAVWCDVLGVARVGRTDDFFAVGGHSLLATTLLSRIADATGCRLPVRLLFDRPVLKDLAFELEEAIVAAALDGPPAPTEAHTGAKGA